MTLFGKRSIDWKPPISQRGYNPVKRPRRSLHFSPVGGRVSAFIHGTCIAALSVFLGGQHSAYSQTGSTVDGPSVSNRVSAGEGKPHFVDLLTDFERKLEQQAQQAEFLIKAQQLREEGEILLQRGDADCISQICRGVGTPGSSREA